MAQNIYDNEAFFSAYRALRREKSYNDLLEQPAMERLLPEVAGLSVLDIGCGYGQNSLAFARRGAKQVVAVDLSERMLAAARAESAHPRILYRRMDMEDLSALTGPFDLVYSSLAFHYAADFPHLIEEIHRLLRPGGILLFSQEHPIVTATLGLRGHHNLDEQGRPVSYTFSDYAAAGRRSGPWLGEEVENYHRPMGHIVTALAQAGFLIQALVEPVPTPEAAAQLPALNKEFIKPTFLLIRAKRLDGDDALQEVF